MHSNCLTMPVTVDVLQHDKDGCYNTADASLLGEGGGILMLESVEGYTQLSPVNEKQAAIALAALAKLHAAAWEDADLLSKAASRLQRHGGSFSLRCCRGLVRL